MKVICHRFITHKLSKTAELRIPGELLVNYNGRVNPLNGTLTAAEGSCADCCGGIAVSKNGRSKVYRRTVF